MVQTTSPVDGDLAFAAIQSRSTFHTATSADSTEFEKTVKHRAIITNVVSALLLGKLVHIVGSDFRKEVDVLIRVELGHFVFRRGFRTLYGFAH